MQANTVKTASTKGLLFGWHGGERRVGEKPPAVGRQPADVLATVIRALTKAGAMARSGQPFQRSTVCGILARLAAIESEPASAAM